MRYGSLIKLKPDWEERYIILHQHVFRGVLDRVGASVYQSWSYQVIRNSNPIKCVFAITKTLETSEIVFCPLERFVISLAFLSIILL